MRFCFLITFDFWFDWLGRVHCRLQNRAPKPAGGYPISATGTTNDRRESAQTKSREAANVAQPSETHNSIELDVVGAIGLEQAEPHQWLDASQPHLAEVVFLGNLPGFGGPWLTQYAHRHAQSQGPVAVLHVDEHHIDVDVVVALGPDQPPIPPDIKQVKPRDDDTSGDQLLNCLYELSELRPSPVQTWLLHVSTDPTGSTLAQALQFPRWTVLSGADDAAVASAYQLLKRLLVEDHHAAKRRVGLMVMGSEEQESQAAVNKLNRAVGGFLNAPVGLVGCRTRMVPVMRRPVGRFVGSDRLMPSVLEFIDTLSGQLLSVQPTSTPQTVAQSSDHIKIEAQSGSDASEEEQSPQFEGLVARHAPTDPQPVPDGMVLEQTAATDQSPPPLQPPQHEPVRESAETDMPNLASYLPAVIELQARCPRHPHVQLVLDDQGRLQLLGRCVDDSHPSQPGDPQMDAARLHHAIVELIETRAWVNEHLDLIRLTQRQCRFDKSSPQLHLFTSYAKAAAKLAGNPERFICFHLLQHVQVGTQTTWACADLN